MTNGLLVGDPCYFCNTAMHWDRGSSRKERGETDTLKLRGANVYHPTAHVEVYRDQWRKNGKAPQHSITVAGRTHIMDPSLNRARDIFFCHFAFVAHVCKAADACGMGGGRMRQNTSVKHVEILSGRVGEHN